MKTLYAYRKTPLSEAAEPAPDLSCDCDAVVEATSAIGIDLVAPDDAAESARLLLELKAALPAGSLSFIETPDGPMRGLAFTTGDAASLRLIQRTFFCAIWQRLKSFIDELYPTAFERPYTSDIVVAIVEADQEKLLYDTDENTVLTLGDFVRALSPNTRYSFAAKTLALWD